MRKAAYFFIGFGILIFHTHMVYGQVTIFPRVDEVTSKDPIQIIRVELTPTYTIIDFYFNASSEETWECVDKDFYITPSIFDHRLYLIMAKGISICPKMTKVNPASRDILFQLYFPPIGESIYKFDAIESKSGLQFHGIHINNDKESVNRPVDSIPVIDQILAFSEKNKDMDSLNGVWIRKIKHRHFNSLNALMSELIDVPDTVLIAKTDVNTYQIYSLDGKALHETITRLTGDLGYFYEEIFPEVNDTGSGYIDFDNEDHFLVSFPLPNRIAQYELLDEFLKSDRLIEDYDYQKLTKEEIKKLIRMLQDNSISNEGTSNNKKDDGH